MMNLKTEMIENACPAKASESRADGRYGTYRHETYYSGTCGMERGYSVLLPADYDEANAYPVFYLLHGIMGNEYAFSGDPTNAVPQIFGNAANDYGRAQWIVILPDLFAKKDPEMKQDFKQEVIRCYDNFINDLINDLMPVVESRYNVKTGRENTAIAGFSLGGRETLFISLKETERFGYVCAISPAPGLVPGKDWAMEHPGQLTPEKLVYPKDAIRPDVLLLLCGTKDSVVGVFPKSYHEIFEANGVDHIWYEVEEADHDNNAIKSGLYNFLKLIDYSKTCGE